MSQTVAHPHAPPRSRSLFARCGPFCAISAFVASVLWEMVLSGRSLYWGDVFLYFYPLEQFVRESLRAGRIPLWNPYVLCGQPLVGNPQAWVYYPTTALLPFLPVWLYLTVNTAAHMIGAGWGTYLYLRRMCGDRLGAVLGAIAYAGSGYVIARAQFPPMLQSLAYLPWMLLLVDRTIDRPRVWYGALLALAIGMELLAAHTQIAYMTFLCAGIYALARLVKIRRHRKRAVRATVELLCAFAIGLMMSAVLVLPAVQLFKASPRGEMTWMQANRFVLEPSQLLNFVAPNFYGSPLRGDFWADGNMWEPCVYLGILPICLAAYAVWNGAERMAVRFFALLGVVALWLSMGRFGGLYWVAFHLIPGLKNFHDPARFAFLTTFCLAMLSAVGMRCLRDRGVRATWRVLLVVAAAVNLWWFSSSFNPTLEHGAFGYRPRVLASTPKAGEGRTLVLMHDQVWRRYLNYGDYGPESARYAHELTDTLIPNIGMRFGVEEAGGYEPVPIRAMTDVNGLVSRAFYRKSPALPGLMGLLNTSVVLLPEGTRYRHPAFAEEDARGVTALRVERPWPRAWLVRATIRVDDPDRAVAALASPDFDPAREAVVCAAPALDAPPAGAPNAVPREGVPLTNAGPHEVIGTVDCGPQSAHVVVSKTAYAGWSARIDGHEASIVRTDRALMGLALGPGPHRVELRYRPATVVVGLYISLTAIGLVLAGLAYGLVARPLPSERAG